MPGVLHEVIIDDVREVFNNWRKANGYTVESTGMVIEAQMMAAISGGRWPTDIRGDAYLLLSDNLPAIVLEVGKMRDGKWNHILHESDNKPVRILRVGFDRVPYMINARHTEAEKSLLAYLCEKLPSYNE